MSIFPLRFIVDGVPISLQASSASRQTWKHLVATAALAQRGRNDELGFVDSRPLSLTVYYFPSGPMEGDLDNIIKPIADSLIGVAYLDDSSIEQIVVQKFEPDAPGDFTSPNDVLLDALERPPPFVYVSLADDLTWRTVS